MLIHYDFGYGHLQVLLTFHSSQIHWLSFALYARFDNVHRPFVVTLLNRMPTFEWYMASLVLTNKHQEDMMTLDKECAQRAARGRRPPLVGEEVRKEVGKVIP